MYCYLAILVMKDESVKVLPKTNKGFEQDYWNYYLQISHVLKGGFTKKKCRILITFL